MTSKRIIGIQAALASAVFMGFAPVFGKQALRLGFSSTEVVAFRTGIAVLLLLILMGLFRRQFFYIYPVGLAGCALAGGVNGLGSIFYYAALQRIDASLGHLLYSFYPVFVALWLIVDRQVVNRLTLVRALFSVPAIWLIINAGSVQIDMMGVVFMIISSCLYALHVIINQRVLFEVPAPTVTLYTLMSMFVVVLAAYLIFDRQVPTMPPGETTIGLWWPVVAMGVVTFLSRFTLFLGVKHLGGLQTALLGLGELLITLLLAWLWLGEHLAPLQWVGAGLLALNLILVGFDKSTPDKKRSRGWLAWLNPPGLR